MVVSALLVAVSVGGALVASTPAGAAVAQPEAVADDVVCDLDRDRPAPAARDGEPGSGERIGPYRIDVRVGDDGRGAVTEHLTYHFGEQPGRAGLTRQLLLRLPCDDRWDLVHPLSEVEVTSPSGAPADVVVEEVGAATLVRIGGGGPAPTGTQDYVLSYQLDGLVRDSGTSQVLTWHVVGEDWDVPLTDITARVEAPAESRGFPVCWAGSGDERRRCTEVRKEGPVMVVEQSALAPGEPLMVSIALPADTVTTPQLVEERPWSLDRVLSVDRRTLGLVLLVLVVAVAAVWGWRQVARARAGGAEP